MGHFSYTCKLSGLPITGGDPAVLIVMKMRKNLYDNGEESLRKYGSTSLVSNDGTQLKFQPVWFPIYCNYNDYGGGEDIKKDDNTKALEDYYGITIEQIIEIVTHGRKDDGYGVPSIFKETPNLPDDYVEGEDWFNRYQRLENDPMPFGNGVYPDVSGKYNKEWEEKGYEGWTISRDGEKIKATKEEYDADFKLIHEQYARYQEWEKNNPDPTDDYGNPKYKEKYKELLSYSGMWVHGEVYDELTNEPTDDDYTKLDLGTPELLNALGFTKLKKKGKGRYDQQFEKDGLILNSDGTWINQNDQQSIYELSDLKEYCNKHGVDIDVNQMIKKDRTEQIFDYVIPNAKSIGQSRYDVDDATKARKEYESLKGKDDKKAKKKMFDLTRMIADALDLGVDKHPMTRTIKYLLLNNDEYRFYNPMTMPYFNLAKEGKLRDNLVRFWRFNWYMYCTGRYYDIVGTSPQDGVHKGVAKLLEVSTKVLDKELKERKKWEDE